MDRDGDVFDAFDLHPTLLSQECVSPNFQRQTAQVSLVIVPYPFVQGMSSPSMYYPA